jgi:serine/threonine protein kinase
MQPLQNPDDVVIPTVVSTRIEEPASFPIPVIYVCEINTMEVIIVDRDTNEEDKTCVPVMKTSTHEDLSTDTSVTLIPGPVRYYHITREVKDAIFGKVYHALALELVPVADLPPMEGEMPHPPPYNWRGGGGLYTLRHRTPHEEMAVKVYFKEKLRNLTGQMSENPLSEFGAMQYLGHRNRYVMGQVGAYQDGDSVYSLMEFCDGGELYDKLDADGPFNENLCRRFFLQILNGLEYCHSMGVAHRDMSLENLIYNKHENYVKIIDFGMCLRVPKDEATGTFLYMPPQGRCGKKSYIAPEVIQNNQNFNPMKVDIWALGVILFTMMSGFPPVESANTADPRYRMVAAGHLRTLIDNWNVSHLMSDSVVNLIESILRPNPGDRLSLAEIRAHPWVQEGLAAFRSENGHSNGSGSYGAMPPNPPVENSNGDALGMAMDAE